QACNPPDTYFALAALLKPLGKKFVYDQHDLCPELYQARFGKKGGALARCLLMLEKATYRVADHVVSTNESYRRMAMDRGGLTSDRVSTVRNGPDLQRLYRVDPDVSLKRGRTYLCCYLGVMGPQDGVDMVLHAAQAVIQQFDRVDVQFAMLGFGDCLHQ